MAQMYFINKMSSKKFGDNSQNTNSILESGASCHMKPQVQNFIPGLLEDANNYIEVADEHHIMAQQKGKVQINMFDDNRDTFIATFQNVLLAPDLCNRLYSIIRFMNQGQTFLFHKGFCTVYFGENEEMRLIYHIVHSGDNHFFGEIKQMSKSKKLAPRKKVSLRLFYHILRHRSTRSLMDIDIENVWKNVELRIEPDPFCT